MRALFGIMYLFFLSGFSTVLNAFLVIYVKDTFSLSYLESMLVSCSFYAGFTLLAPLCGTLFRHHCYLRQIRLGALLALTGTLPLALFGDLINFSAILGSIFLIGAGIAVVQVGGNPYIFDLIGTHTRGRRLALVQTMTALGMFIAPYFASISLVANVSNLYALQSSYTTLAYLWGIGTITTLVLPPSPPLLKKEKKTLRAHQDPTTWIGFFAIFLAIGAEITVGIHLIPLLSSSYTLNITPILASQLAGIFWGGFVIGRLYSFWILKFIHPATLLKWHSIASTAITCSVLLITGWVTAITILFIGFTTSVMYPLIYSLILEQSICSRSEVSGYLATGNLGGAFLPLLQGVIADKTNLPFSFVAPLLAFIGVALIAHTLQRRCRMAQSAT